jgi:hypothetical protein
MGSSWLLVLGRSMEVRRERDEFSSIQKKEMKEMKMSVDILWSYGLGHFCSQNIRMQDP